MAKHLWVSTRKGLFRLDRGAGGWTIANLSFPGDNVTLTLQDPRTRHVHAGLNLGHFGVKYRRSKDAGATWEDLPAPPLPAVEGDAAKDAPSVTQIWALEAGLADQPGRLWAGTLPGALFTSTDDGDSWQLVDSLWDMPERAQWMPGPVGAPGLHSICVDPRDGRRVSAAVSCGGIWHTEDLGKTWSQRGEGLRQDYVPPEQAYSLITQDVHHMVRCPASPDAVWVQHHNGIFRSTDDARTFEELKDVPPSVFGFVVAVHPKDANTAWFVPATKDEKRIPVGGRVVVSRTRDGGKTFQVLTNGLPQEHAYDLVYRHALDVDETGDTLAFGSTTGALWVSENGGDSWTEVSAHLPPIAAVRFG